MVRVFVVLDVKELLCVVVVVVVPTVVVAVFSVVVAGVLSVVVEAVSKGLVTGCDVVQEPLHEGP